MTWDPCHMGGKAMTGTVHTDHGEVTVIVDFTLAGDDPVMVVQLHGVNEDDFTHGPYVMFPDKWIAERLTTEAMERELASRAARSA